jgi:hypothetical protein
MTFVTVIGSASALILFLVTGAILGQDLGSATFVTREIGGHGLWTLLLSPIYIPLTIAAYRLTLTARNR